MQDVEFLVASPVLDKEQKAKESFKSVKPSASVTLNKTFTFVRLKDVKVMALTDWT